MLSLVSYKYHSQLIGWKSDTPWEEFQVGCKERKDVLETNIFRLVFMRVIKKSMNLETLNVDNNIYFTMRVFCWRRKWQPTPVFLPGEFHGQRNLAGYSPQGCKELDMQGDPLTHSELMWSHTFIHWEHKTRRQGGAKAHEYDAWLTVLAGKKSSCPECKDHKSWGLGVLETTMVPMLSTEAGTQVVLLRVGWKNLWSPLCLAFWWFLHTHDLIPLPLALWYSDFHSHFTGESQALGC